MGRKDIKPPIVFIKIGGSLITDKNKPFSLKKKTLEIIAKEIKRVSGLNKLLIVGHGAGSFAHVPAKKYETHKGILGERSYQGMAEVADAAAKLNRIVIEAFLEKGVRAVSVNPLSMMLAENHALSSLKSGVVEELLKLKMLPVVYGDVIVDLQVGCTIFSTEKVLGYLALDLKKKGYEIERIIHCGKTEGVYDEKKRTIKVINSKNFDNYRKILKESDGMDVTGGMMHKVEETMKLARHGIPGLIIDGVEKGTLFKAAMGEKIKGTKVEW